LSKASAFLGERVRFFLASTFSFPDFTAFRFFTRLFSTRRLSFFRDFLFFLRTSYSYVGASSDGRLVAKKMLSALKICRTGGFSENGKEKTKKRKAANRRGDGS